MSALEGIEENFRFIVCDVASQAKTVRRFLEAPSRELYDKIISRDDYIDNLKTIIENKCFSKINTVKSIDENQLNKIRAVQIISVNLERIADFLVNVARQMAHLEDSAYINNFQWRESCDIVESCLELILPAFNEEDMAKSLAICKSENDFDTLYKDVFDRIMKELSSGKQVQNLITVLFIFRYFERIGDSLLNIGEAVIFSIIGERIKIEQFDALQRTLSESGMGEGLSGIDFKGIWGSRSGCRIGRVALAEGAENFKDRQSSIYKEGSLAKIRREKENIEVWQSLFPGLVAEVFGYNEDAAENKGSLLVEFLPGCTLDEVVLTASEDVLGNAMFVLEQTVRHTWNATLRLEPMPVDYISQLEKRLEPVLQVHPEFWRQPSKFGPNDVPAAWELIGNCKKLELEINAPFSVFTHGDFNSNNVVYDHEKQQVHYIDLFRSRQYDYLQDVSTFLVSNFRLPVFALGLRVRIDSVIDEFYSFAQNFAQEHGDATFQARLGLGLARSFYTSTRFELNHKFAKDMYLRSLYLLEKLWRHSGKPWEEFQLPLDVLRY